MRHGNPFPFIESDRDEQFYWHGAFSYNGSNAVLNSLLTSGMINVIKNDSLKYLLSSWPELVKDLSEDEQLHISFIVKDYAEYERAYLTIGDSPPKDNTREKWLSDRSVIKDRYMKALNDPLLMNFLQTNLIYIRIILQEISKLEATIQEIKQLIDMEIALKQ